MCNPRAGFAGCPHEQSAAARLWAGGLCIDRAPGSGAPLPLSVDCARSAPDHTAQRAAHSAVHRARARHRVVYQGAPPASAARPPRSRGHALKPRHGRASFCTETAGRPVRYQPLAASASATAHQRISVYAPLPPLTSTSHPQAQGDIRGYAPDTPKPAKRALGRLLSAWAYPSQSRA